MTGKRFWIAHTRGPDFKRLAALGFTTLFPRLDDYVFLEAKPAHQRLLDDELDLAVSFLRVGGVPTSISEAELEAMANAATQDLQPGDQVEVISGYAESLSGVVVSLREDGVECQLEGWNRRYDVLVEKMDLVRTARDPEV